ncbi:MAG: OmpA family protein [Hyphomicrobiaceae bacterium]
MANTPYAVTASRLVVRNKLRNAVRLVCVLAAATVSTALAQAQDTQTGAANVTLLEGPPGAKTAQGRDGRSAEPAPSPDEAAAAKLYAEALPLLAEGHLAKGQRLLESLVVRFPETAAAHRARHDLAKLYAALSRPDGIEWARRSFLGARGLSGTLDPPPAAAGKWRTKVRLSQAVHDRFRLLAGDRVFFADGNSMLDEQAWAVVRQQARWLNHRSALHIVVEGHSADAGSRADNERLAHARAEAVRDGLIARGIDARRIEVRVFGNRMPVATCAGPACAPQNRRAVTVLLAEPSSD